ncbi:MAG TPA: DUF6527 family protein [Acidimicrobiales bacterium]|nr:DUF6527 family protein [Acidimicrobiales bacterium]
MDLMGSLVDGWRRRRLTEPRLRRVEAYPSRQAMPARLNRRRLAVVGTPVTPKWLIFWCPCGHGHRVELNAQSAQHPRWRLTLDHRGRPSVSPSVDVQEARRCHFWLGHGRVTWCPDLPG